MQGTTGEFTCEYGRVPSKMYEIRWYRDDGSGSSNRGDIYYYNSAIDYEEKFSKNNANSRYKVENKKTLIIKDMIPSDTGIYFCEGFGYNLLQRLSKCFWGNF